MSLRFRFTVFGQLSPRIENFVLDVTRGVSLKSSEALDLYSEWFSTLSHSNPSRSFTHTLVFEFRVPGFRFLSFS